MTPTPTLTGTHTPFARSLLEAFLATQGLDSQTFVQLVQRCGCNPTHWRPQPYVREAAAVCT